MNIHGIRGSKTFCGKKKEGMLWAVKEEAVTCKRCLRFRERLEKKVSKERKIMVIHKVGCTRYTFCGRNITKLFWTDNDKAVTCKNCLVKKR